MPTATPEFLSLQTAVTGRYSLERELGRGGMGIVFLAREVALDRPVALKLLPPELAARDGVKQQFLQEARTAAKLSHPNIVPIYSVDDVDGLVFYAMAYIEGGTLGERVRSRGPLSDANATKLVREVAWALAYAHLQGVVHRDVKPDNILLEQGTGRALVSDFGIALVGVDLEPGPADQVVGTAEFMSPEQATGASADARSDLYSLGALGFYAVSGQVPFTGPSALAILAKHVGEPPPPVASKAPGVSSPLARVIDRCLRKERERRFGDGAAIADELAYDEAVNRALPVPLRVFIKRLRETSRSISVLGVFLLLLGAPTGIGAFLAGEITVLFVIAAVLAVFTGGFGVALAYEARKLLRAGHTLEDARLAIQQDVIQRNEEFRFEVGERTTLYDRILTAVTVGGLSVAAAAGLGVAIVVQDEWLEAVLWLGVLGGGVAGLMRLSRAQHRGDIAGEQWLRVWGGRLGESFFKLGGVGLRDRAALAAGSYRPTEMAIGLAAERLFEDLPKETRRSLSGLPATLRKLESDVRILRGQVKELNAVLAEIGDDPAAPGADARDRVRAYVTATRDEAERRLHKAFSALETIRLGLLRMHAGEGVVQSVTMGLEAAQDLSGDMANLLEGHREVERLLAERRATGTFRIPSPPRGTAAPGGSGDPRS